MTERDTEVLNHYLSYGYELVDEKAFNDLPPGAPSPIRVVTLKSKQYINDWLYATVGMGRTPLPHKNQTPTQHAVDRVELAIPAKEPSPDLARLVIDMAAYPFYAQRFIGVGHKIARSPESGVVRGSPLTDMLLTPPYFQPPDFQFITHSDGTWTRVLQIAPVYPEELKFAHEHGWKSLVKRLEEAQVSDTDGGGLPSLVACRLPRVAT